MLVTLPVPGRITQYFPSLLVDILQKFAFYTFACMLTIPWLFCVYRIVVVPLGRKKRIKYTLNEQSSPKVVVVMPVYKEPPESLWTALNSVVASDYPSACIHLFVSFDGDSIDELYLKTIDRLGIPVTLEEFPKSIDVAYRGARVTVSRFPHGGKRHCQKATFLLIDKIYKRYLRQKDDLFILFIDSDCILDSVCIQNLMYDMQLKPRGKHNMLAMTGIITTRTDKHSFLTLMQDMEYLHGQMFERSVESGCGAVTCLPGALNLLRFSAFRNMAKFYFSDRAETCEDLFDYAKTHLGEDRWLTHLFMLGAKEAYQIQLSTSAFCKTEAVQTFRSLLKQRRRWFLGFITNEVCMLTDGRLWRKYPMLCLLRFMTINIRTTSMLLLITVVSVSSTSGTLQRLPWEFMCISCGLNWILMFYFAVRLHRWKSVLYPLMFAINPFMNWIFMVYGIFTAGQRTWGGPRVDAGAADAEVTPQQAIEHAIETGDDLNVKPETFKPAMEVRRRRVRPSALQPSSSIEGRFAPAEPGPSEHWQKDLPSTAASESEMSAHLRRWEHNSLDMSDTEGISVHTPRRVTSISGEDYGLSTQTDGMNEHERADFSSSWSQITSREGRINRRSTVTGNGSYPPSAYPQSRDLVGRSGRRTRSSSLGLADAQELSRQLNEIAARQSIGDSTVPSEHRSPLGRINPLTAVGFEDDYLSLHQEQGSPGQEVNNEAEGSGRKAAKRPSRRPRRSLSPSSMV
ncbi:chitin synthase [Exophiala aquamarina CBS 119918]|uniref:chitin synthase n=1 Tax=Exophiala aquamarina CBS 119918 TaxID=1182545 RepID=A0A072P4X1_9EURO|nr:chitin synthase [Exophiala aquamarina CBS 119918]KEF55164.1 chitin synthase [Exophiala aquamarina CBS 119918]